MRNSKIRMVFFFQWYFYVVQETHYANQPHPTDHQQSIAKLVKEWENTALILSVEKDLCEERVQQLSDSLNSYQEMVGNHFVSALVESKEAGRQEQVSQSFILCYGFSFHLLTFKTNKQPN